MSFAVVGAIAGTAVSIGGAALAGAGALAGGAVSLGAGAVGALGATGAFLGEAAIGAGGAAISGIGSLGAGLYEGAAGIVSGAGTLFGGGATPGLTVGQQMAAIAEPGFYEAAVGGAGGLFSNLSLDTLGNIATLGYGLFTSEADRKLVEKAIEAQRGAGYIVSAPGGTPSTAFAPSIMVPAAAVAATKELNKMVLLKYGALAVAAYLLFKGLK